MKSAPHKPWRSLCALLLSTGLLGACSSQLKPIPTVDYVDIPRFMGDWYVIGNIPTFIEKNAYNALENYQRNADGSRHHLHFQ
ncbi:MAG: lipocalin family protein [Thiolinea sp.]